MDHDVVNEMNRESVVYHVEKFPYFYDRPQIKSYIDWLRSVVDLEENIFNSMYFELIERFVSWTQCLKQSGLKWDDTLLNYSLSRARSLLEMNESMIKNQQVYEVELLRYCIFSIGLLQDIGILASDTKIFMCNDKGEFIKIWEPLVESISDAGKFFKVRFIKDLGEEYRSSVTPLIASRIMPDLGMSWLNESSSLMIQWVKSLVLPEDGFAQMGVVYDPEKLQEKIKKKKLKPIHLKTTEPKETLAGEVYWAWLKQQIEKGRLKVGHKDSYAHLVEGGLLLEHERMFKDFSKEHKEYSNWSDVHKQFNRIGVTRLSGEDVKYERYFLESPHNPLASKKSSIFSKNLKVQLNESKTNVIKSIFPRSTKSNDNKSSSPQKQIQGHLILNPHMFINPASLGAVRRQIKPQSKVKRSGLLTRIVMGVIGVNLLNSKGK